MWPDPLAGDLRIAIDTIDHYYSLDATGVIFWKSFANCSAAFESRDGLSLGRVEFFYFNVDPSPFEYETIRFFLYGNNLFLG